MEARLILRSTRVVTPSGVRPAAVRVAGERIDDVLPHDAPASSVPVHDFGDAVILPGLVDTHVHVNEPGRTEWEGFDRASRAAAAGGVTTIVDMPLNSTPATTTVDALRAKVHAGLASCRVDFALWGGAVPGNVRELEPLWRAGALGFKCFLVDSGVDDFAPLDDEGLALALDTLAGLGATLLVHAEDPALVRPAPSSRRHADWLASRPPESEIAAVTRVLEHARRRNASVHVVHLAAPGALPALDRARADGVRATVETCPHYLTLAAEEIADGDTLAKCAPPIRDRAARDDLWRALAEGRIDFLASDHSPCPPDRKHRQRGDFGAAWGGIASLQLSLPLVWTGARARGHGLDRVTSWLADRPARRFGLDRKGRIERGFDADLVVFRADKSFVVEEGSLYHRHPLGPYEGRELTGVVARTYVRGRLVYERGGAPAFAGAPAGRWIRGAGA